MKKSLLFAATLALAVATSPVAFAAQKAANEPAQKKGIRGSFDACMRDMQKNPDKMYSASTMAKICHDRHPG
jgi:hypothetical protein